MEHVLGLQALSDVLRANEIIKEDLESISKVVDSEVCFV